MHPTPRQTQVTQLTVHQQPASQAQPPHAQSTQNYHYQSMDTFHQSSVDNYNGGRS